MPGNVTQEVGFAPNQLIKQGAELVTSAEDLIEELPTAVRAVLVQAAGFESEQSNQLACGGLSPTEKKVYELLSAEEPGHIDEIVERSGLNSSEVLATLFDLEMKGIIRQLPGKQFSKVLLCEGKRYRGCGWEHPKDAETHQEHRQLGESACVKS